MRVALIGRISPWKGQDVFVEAANLVIPEIEGVEFWIVGEAMFGEVAFKIKIEQLIKKLHIENKVLLKGFKDDIREILEQVDLVVHASTVPEPFGQVIIEAMSAGRAVIATHGGGAIEIVEHGETGILIPMNDAQALAQAIKLLLTTPELRAKMGHKGRKRALDLFNINRTVDQIQALYGHAY